MTMKEQESKALEQIKKIVAGLGENSYIATAFEGCFEIAEENIENDFGCSMKQRADSSAKAAAELSLELAKVKEQLTALTNDHQKLGIEYGKEHERAEHYKEEYIKACDANAENVKLNLEKQEALNKAQQEILILKAKLYDLITK